MLFVLARSIIESASFFALFKISFASASALMGEKVYHQTFGYGKVVGVEGDKLDVWFDNYGNKKLLKDYVTKVG